MQLRLALLLLCLTAFTACQTRPPLNSENQTLARNAATNANRAAPKPDATPAPNSSQPPAVPDAENDEDDDAE